MNKITFPLNPRMNSPEVGDLQTGLQLLLDRAVILASGEGARRRLSAALQRERGGQAYGEATQQLVHAFQRAMRLEASGSVEKPTATALNRSLAEPTDNGG